MKTWLATSFLLLAPWIASSILAQQDNSTSSSFEKKIVITKRSVDANGDEITETIVKKGKAAESFDSEQYLRENRSDKTQIEIKVTDTSRGKAEYAKSKGYGKSYSRNDTYEMEDYDEERTFLGVQEDSDEDSDKPGLIVEVVRGSAAEKAGLRDNDMILKLNDMPTNEWSDLSNFIKNTRNGDKIRIAYNRNGKDLSTEATLTKRSDIKSDDKKQPHGFLGVSERNYNDAGAKVSIINDSGADKAGLKSGDVITKMDDTNIDDYEDITDFLKYTKPGDQVVVDYERDGKNATATVTLGETQTFNWNNNWKDNWNNVTSWTSNFNIDVRQKEACLGVYTDTDGAEDLVGAKIDAFTKESAAREVKLVENDLILSINSIRVKGSDELWNEIAKYKAGDAVTVEYLRGERRETIKATLKACRDNSSRVTIEDTDDKGNTKSRQFTIGSWGEKEKKQMQNQRVIAIRRGEGDAQTKVAPDQLAKPNRNLSLQSFRAYPNPSSGQVTVEFNGDAVATVVSLFDLSGRQLFREELNAFSGFYSQPFDLTDYTKGTLLIHIQQGEKIYTEQIVVN